MSGKKEKRGRKEREGREEQKLSNATFLFEIPAETAIRKPQRVTQSRAGQRDEHARALLKGLNEEEMRFFELQKSGKVGVEREMSLGKVIGLKDDKVGVVEERGKEGEEKEKESKKRETTSEEMEGDEKQGSAEEGAMSPCRSVCKDDSNQKGSESSDVFVEDNLSDKEVIVSYARKGRKASVVLEISVDGDVCSLPCLEKAQDEGECAEVEKIAQNILRGCLDAVPPVDKKIVRIFTSSTFTDTTLERNYLLESVYPRLKDYCMERYGLDFQVVDMRWGVRDEATDDHMTVDLCMQEIENCQRLSLGPNFVAFLGQKYGYRPIPTRVTCRLMELMKEYVREGWELVEKWYLKDDNALPPVFNLRPISSVFPNFKNKKNPDLMRKDHERWWDVLEKLQSVMRCCVEKLWKLGKISEDQKQEFYISVTEQEIRKGIVNNKTANKNCLAFVTNLQELEVAEDNLVEVKKYVDLKGTELDTEANLLMTQLRDHLLTSSLTENNISRFTVKWNPDTDREAHKSYLTLFGETFYSQVCALVEKAVDENSNFGAFDQSIQQMQQHLNLCKCFCKEFTSRNDVLSAIENYLFGESTQPLIIWGDSGSGKTSVMAKAFTLLKDWIASHEVDPDILKIIRFIGTSQDSSRTVPLLTSICQQIYYFLRQPSPLNLPADPVSLVLYFKNLLALASSQKTVFLFIDSLDQLYQSDKQHHLCWVDPQLSKNCKFIVSMVTEDYKACPSIKEYPNILKMPALGKTQGLSAMRSMMANNSRTLSLQQWRCVENVLEECSDPLYIKLLSGVVSRWKSYTPIKSSDISRNVHDAITKLFEETETLHGKCLVSHALSYITASKDGLSEVELEDVLSLDEEVLNDVYQYHVPPVRRIPPLLWARIRSHLCDYMTERDSGGVNVINWYHKQFIEVSIERYLKEEERKREVHSMLVDYFLGTWGGKAKPYTFTESQRKMFGLASIHGSCDRKVSEQPLYYIDSNNIFDNSNKRYNLRKLLELPHHLNKSRRYLELFSKVLFNFEWLQAKLSCTPFQSVLDDFEDVYNETVEDKELIKLTLDALRLSASVIYKRHVMLGPQLVGRLLPLSQQQPWIKHLLQQCKTEGIKSNALIPLFHCYQSPGGPLETLFERHQFAPFGLCFSSDHQFMYSASNKFIVKDKNSENIQIKSIGTAGLVMAMEISLDNSRIIAFTNNSDIIIYYTLIGETKLIDSKVLQCDDDLLGVAVNTKYFVVWSLRHCFVFDFNGELISKKGVPQMEKDANVVAMVTSQEESEKIILVWKLGFPLGVTEPIEMSLAVYDHFNAPHEPSKRFSFHSGFAFSKNRKTLYVCQQNLIQHFTYEEKIKDWKLLGSKENSHRAYSLFLSDDQMILGLCHTTGYVLWFLTDNNRLTLALPKEVRNFPRKSCVNNLVLFFKHNSYMLAPVRDVLYVWQLPQGHLINVLKSHFGRIISLKLSTDPSKFATSSLDRSIKIWNIDRIHEKVYPIEKHDKQIYKVLCLNLNGKWKALTTTRNCMGIWDLETGRLVKTLTGSKVSSFITDSAATSDGKFIICVEVNSLIVWDASTLKMVRSEEEEEKQEVLQLLVTPDDKHMLVVRKEDDARDNACLEMLSIPDKELLYKVSFSFLIFKNVIITSDLKQIVIPGVRKNCEGKESESRECLMVCSLLEGKLLSTNHPKYTSLKPWIKVVAMPRLQGGRVGLVDEEKGSIWNWRKKTLVRSVMNWSGECSKDGLLGLSDPTRGGLDVINLKSGELLCTLIPRPSEGVFHDNQSRFTTNNKHIYFYHSGKKSIRIFRFSNSAQIADFRVHASVSANIAPCHDSRALVIGGIDGSLVVLAIADSNHVEHLQLLNEKMNFL